MPLIRRSSDACLKHTAGSSALSQRRQLPAMVNRVLLVNPATLAGIDLSIEAHTPLDNATIFNECTDR